MPIEIRITDITTLSTREIETLTDYLIRSRTDDTVIDEVFEQQREAIKQAQVALHNAMTPSCGNVFKDLQLENPEALLNDAKLKQVMKNVLNTTVSGMVLPDCMDPEKQVKKRKRRTKAEMQDVATITPEMFKQPYELKDPIVILPEDTETIQDLVNDVESITPQGLIMFVLENAREKRFTFDQAVKVANKYGLVNLNELEEPKNAHLVCMIYKDLKELMK